MSARPFTFLLILLAAAKGQCAEFKFALTIDGKSEGSCTLTSKQADGSELEIRGTIAADRASLLSYQGLERWKDGRLVRMEGSGTENRKNGKVAIVAGKEGYTLKAGAKEVAIHGDVWPTTFWIRPDADRPLVVDAITGDTFHAKIEKIGADRVVIAEKPIATIHYRLTFDGRVVELWYNKDGHLVRRKWSVAGRTFELLLTDVKDQ
jgi:hypothetical protein